MSNFLYPVDEKDRRITELEAQCAAMREALEQEKHRRISAASRVTELTTRIEVYLHEPKRARELALEEAAKVAEPRVAAAYEPNELRVREEIAAEIRALAKEGT